MQQVEVDR